MRIGIGYDVHKLVKDRDLIIGGIKIESNFGLLGHSDADVLVHAIMDAMLGALSLGDIGTHFPDTDINYKDIDSCLLLKKVFEIITENGYKIENIDSVVTLQSPKISEYIPKMKEKISKILKISPTQISIKATTTEKLGFVGKGDGAESYAVCLLSEI